MRVWSCDSHWTLKNSSFATRKRVFTSQIQPHKLKTRFQGKFRSLKFFSNTTLLCPNIMGKAFREPWDTPKPIPHHLSTSRTILRTLKFCISKKIFQAFYKQFQCNFEILRAWGSKKYFFFKK